MARIIGCRDLHIAKLTEDVSDGVTAKYDAPVAVPSLVSMKIKDNVEQSKFFSDDTVEQTFSKTSGKEVTIELGYLSNELEALITGKTVDANGVLVQSGDDMPKEVALLFRAPKSSSGDFRYICLYKGTLARTESEYNTQEEGVESSNVTLTGVFSPLISTGEMAAIADSDDIGTTESIAAWFTTVYKQTMNIV